MNCIVYLLKMQYNKVSSVTDAQNMITHYLALFFTIKLLNLEKTVLVTTERNFMRIYFNFFCACYSSFY